MLCRIEMDPVTEQMLVWPDGEPTWAPPEKYTMIGGAWNKAADPTREYYEASREHDVARLVVEEFFAEAGSLDARGEPVSFAAVNRMSRASRRLEGAVSALIAEEVAALTGEKATATIRVPRDDSPEVWARVQVGEYPSPRQFRVWIGEMSGDYPGLLFTPQTIRARTAEVMQAA